MIDGILNKPLFVPFRSGTSSPKDLVMDERATPIAAVSPAVSLTSLPEPGSIQSETGKRYPMVRTAVWNKIAKTLKHQVSQLYSQHWVLKPPSVRGVEVAKPSAAAKARVWV